jgi:Ion channel
MLVDIILFAAGLILAWLTLRDVFDTVVVPGGSRASLQVTRRVGMALLAIWKQVRGRKRGISDSFAPLVLVSSFAIWMSLLAMGFGLMAFAARRSFTPPIHDMGDAVYQAGGAMLTVGLSNHYPGGAGRWIILAAGFCGLAVMTMAVTYLLEVQSSIARRDIGIIKLNTSGGDPPSALTMLERFAALHLEREIEEVLKEGRNWCATVRQSHSAHPSLIYFKSISTGAGWPAALGAILDLGLIAEHLLDDPALYGPAVLLRDEGARMARELALMARVEPKPIESSAGQLQQLASRLASSGYRLKDTPNFEAMSQQRAAHQACVEALADHLGRPATVLIRQS